MQCHSICLKVSPRVWSRYFLVSSIEFSNIGIDVQYIATFYLLKVSTDLTRFHKAFRDRCSPWRLLCTQASQFKCFLQGKLSSCMLSDYCVLIIEVHRCHNWRSPVSSLQPAAQMRTYQERSRDMFDYYIFWECSAARVCSVLASRVLRVTRSAWRLWLIKTHCVYTPTIIQHQL